jgi:hypothetical protein
VKVDDDHEGCGRRMMTLDAHEGGVQSPRSLWRRVAQSLFAVLCVVAASLAGTPAGNSPLQPAASDKATSADSSRDYGRELQKPNREIAAERTAKRGVDGGVSVSDSGSGIAVPTSQDFAWLPDAGAAALPSNERRPAWLTVRAGYSRAPPTMIGRIRLFA